MGPDEAPQDPSAALMRMIGASRVSQAVNVAAQLGVADHLVAGPCHVSVLAERVEAHAPSLLRLMRALAAVGVFEESPDSPSFGLTPLSQRLLSHHPLSLRFLAIYSGTPHVYQSWGHLLDSVRSGQCAYTSIHSRDMFETMAGSPAAAEVYNRAMSNISAADASTVLGAYDFSREQCVLDVGGGEGVLMLRILGAHPALKGHLLELPPVAAAARRCLQEAGAADRCTVHEGNFLEPFPMQEPASVCILKNIVLNWDMHHAALILQRCFEALAPQGKVLVMEPVTGEGSAGSGAALVDLNMLVVCPGGQLRTRSEHAGLLRQAGFTLRRILSPTSSMHIVEGVKDSRHL